MEIRRMAAGDQALVMEAAHLFDSPPNIEAVCTFLADPRSYLLMAYDAGAPVGFARGHALNEIERRERQMFLYEIGVAERYRRRGAARALIEEFGRIARAEGFWEMFVITNSSNLPAMRLYESTGGLRPAEDDVVFCYVWRPRTGRK